MTSIPDEARALLGEAWQLISSTPGGAWDDLPAGWRDDAESWRKRCLALGQVIPAEPEPAAEPELPRGEYARVEIMGHDSVTGWVTEGTRAGAPVMVVRDWDGQVLREVPGHSLYQFLPLATPLKRPEPRAAITVGSYDPDIDDTDAWAGGDPVDDEKEPF